VSILHEHGDGLDAHLLDQPRKKLGRVLVR
jgi:hypothetical protein